MSVRCQACGRRAQLYLCQPCTDTARKWIGMLPWLFGQLDVTVTRRDHLTGPAIGRSSERPAPINFDALDTMLNAERTLTNIIRALLAPNETLHHHTVPRRFIGPLRPGWRRDPISTLGESCAWLAANHRRLPRHTRAGDLWRDLRDLCGEHDGSGVLVTAINRQERRYYGPCSHPNGRDRRGRTIECGGDIYAPRDVDMVTCPDCGTSVDAGWQLDQTKARTDLRTMDTLIDTMRSLGEPVGRNRVQQWINAGALVRRGYYNADRGITSHRVRRGDPAVYSLEQARVLRGPLRAAK